MRKVPLNSKGFGLVAILLVIVVLAGIGGAGAYVYHKNHKAKAASSASATTTSKSSSSSQKNTPAPVDPYAGWASETLGSAGLALKYPSDWTTQDTTACDGAHFYTIYAPSSEVHQAELTGVLRYGLTVITDAELSGTPKCSASASSLNGMSLSTQSQSVLIGSGALKGKYAVIDGDVNGISGMNILNDSYGPEKKITETGVISVGGKNLQITSSFSGGQSPVGVSVSGFLNSQLYKDTLYIVDSLNVN